MKNYLFIFYLCSLLVQAQNNRFVFEYTYVPNLNKPTEIRKDLMALDIRETGSSFRSLHAIKTDSLTKALLSPSAGSLQLDTNSSPFKTMASMKENNMISYKVTKEYPSYTTYFYDIVDMDLYKVKESEPMQWKISEEKTKIGAHNAQKATTSFGGRQWTAWFTADIPIQDGPYKFCGLPGLIIKIEDGTKTHKMELIAQNKLDSSNFDDTKPTGFRLYRSEISATKEEFRKMYQDYLKNPTKSLSNDEVSIINNGVDMTGNREMQKDIEKRIREKEERYSNKIEPLLYK